MAKARESAGADVASEPPAAFPMSLEEFARTHRPGQSVELMGGFIRYARRHDWSRATSAEWVARYEMFRVSPA